MGVGGRRQASAGRAGGRVELNKGWRRGIAWDEDLWKGEKRTLRTRQQAVYCGIADARHGHPQPRALRTVNVSEGWPAVSRGGCPRRPLLGSLLPCTPLAAVRSMSNVPI